MLHSSPLNDRISVSLKAIREAAGLSQRQMAAAIGTNPTRINLIEKGVHHVRAVEMVAWCQAASVDPADFVRDLFKQ